MMTPSPAIYSLATSNLTLRALIGYRLYPDRAPQDAPLPFGVFQRITDAHDQHLRGAGNGARAMYQLSFVAATRSEANAISEAARNVFDGYRGTVGDMLIQCITVDAMRDTTDEIEDGSGKLLHGAQLDLDIAFTRTAPSLMS